MPQTWIIMGGANVGKSALIRALTGVARKTENWPVATRSGTINVTIYVRSLQEKGISPGQFIQQNKGASYILLPLRVNATRRFPDGLQYILTFLQAGWVVNDIVVLNRTSLPYSLPQGAPPPYFIPQHIGRRGMPANQAASIVKQRWNWL